MRSQESLQGWEAVGGKAPAGSEVSRATCQTKEITASYTPTKDRLQHQAAKRALVNRAKDASSRTPIIAPAHHSNSCDRHAENERSAEDRWPLTRWRRTHLHLRLHFPTKLLVSLWCLVNKKKPQMNTQKNNKRKIFHTRRINKRREGTENAQMKLKRVGF